MFLCFSFQRGEHLINSVKRPVNAALADVFQSLVYSAVHS